MIPAWFLHQLRRFNRNKTNSVINIFGLSLGIFVFLLIFSYVRHEFSYDAFHQNQNQIFQLLRSGQGDNQNSSGTNTQAAFPAVLEPVLRSSITGIEAVSRLTMRRTLVVETTNLTFYEDQYFAGDHDIFNILTFELLAGSNTSALKNQKTVALSEKTARKYFGSVDVIGKSIELTGNQPLGTYVIDAVFRDFPTNSSFNFNLIIRFEDFVNAIQPADLTKWNNWNYNYFIKTGKDVNLRAIEESIAAYMRTDQPDFYRPELKFMLDPLGKMYLNPKVSFAITARNDSNRLYLLSAIGLLVLIVAIINYINLTTARSMLRAKEVGIRKVSGAQRPQLLLQFLGDAFGTSLISLGVAILGLFLIWPTFLETIGKEIPLAFFTDSTVLLGTFVFPFFLSIIAGLYPALYLSSFNPVKTLKGVFARSQESSLSRDVMITAQFIISGGLIIAVIIINMQLKYVQTNDPGFSREQILTIPMADEGVRNSKEQFQTELLKNSAIESVAMSTSLPHAVGSYQNTIWKTIDQEAEVTIYSLLADYNFLDLYNIKLLAGRNFSPDIKTDRISLIINETAANTYGWDNPVGMEFTDKGGDTVRIIGVMKDIHIASYREPIKPFAIGLIDKYAYHMSVRVRSNDKDLPELLNYIETAYKRFATTKLPYTYNFFDEAYDKLYKNEYQLGKLINTFSIIAVLIAALGLYSISMHSTNLRLKEIGIRKVLGAQVSQIVLILARKFVLLVAVSFLISVPFTYFLMSNWLNSFAYHISISSIPFILAFLVTILVSIGTISIHSLKAAILNPVNVLRRE